MQQKKEVKIEHLVNWYFGNFCAKCGKIDDIKENYAKKCLDKIQLIVSMLKQNGTEILTYKEFLHLIRDQEFCKPIKRSFHECPICKKLGINIGK